MAGWRSDGGRGEAGGLGKAGGLLDGRVGRKGRDAETQTTTETQRTPKTQRTPRNKYYIFLFMFKVMIFKIQGLVKVLVAHFNPGLLSISFFVLL